MKKLNCDNCGEKINKTIKKEQTHYFCDKKCEKEYKYNATHEERQCTICLKLFYAIKISSQKYCSVSCQIEWQRQFPRTKENHPNYIKDVDRNFICEWCFKVFETKPYKKKNGTVRFCSKKCRQEWYAKEWSQRNEWRQSKREWAIFQLESGNSIKSNSAPQIAINKLLTHMNIEYQNEKVYNDFCVDNFINDYNLVIEVMGTFFHCDIRKYKIISYSNQVDRIKRDKSKHTYIKSFYNVEVLYLWEKDINENIKLCENLIKEYINNAGVLKNYHSINYSMKNNFLSLNKNVIIPYMEWNIEKLNAIIDIQVKEKRSKKQIDKWTIFNCEYCKKEKEELTSHYLSAEKHFCSMFCFNEYKKENKNNWHRKTPFLSNNKIS